MGCELTKTIMCTAITIDLYFPTEWQGKRKYSACSASYLNSYYDYNTISTKKKIENSSFEA
jgi:hypothetical protein